MKTKEINLIKFLDILILVGSFIILAMIKDETTTYVIPYYALPFLIMTFLWVVISLLSGKFSRLHEKPFTGIFSSLISADFAILALAAIIIFIFKLPYQSRLLIFGTIGLAFLFEILFFTVLFFHYKLKKNPEYDSSILQPVYYKENGYKPAKEDINLKDFPEVTNQKYSIKSKLNNKYLVKKPELFPFIDKYVDLDNIWEKHSQVINTRTLYNIKYIDPESLQIFINLHRINDFKKINCFFKQVYENLAWNGYFLGRAYTKEERKRNFFEKHVKIVGHILYYFDFFFKRLLPKFPVFKEIIYAINRGEGRIISKAEVLGRLLYCGFELVKSIEVDNHFYFLGVKTALPRKEKAPSIGFIIKMKRVGKNKELINIYKLRTMHLYSEYVQDYVYLNGYLENNGKFRNDFRITGWGKIFRKLWIDELPQLFNLFRGDIKLVGVRALSEHYFSLYPKELQDLRTKYKPGLIPPFYKDVPNSFEEILASEKRYLEQYEKHPYLTDLKYFFGAMFNIFFKKARSK